MLETWYKKARAGLAGNGRKPFRWLGIFPPGVWIVIAVLAFVGGRLYWLNAQRPVHRQEITAAFGGISIFEGAPQMNHDGSQLTYVATEDHGNALFLYDTATGRKQTVSEEDEHTGWFKRGLELLPGNAGVGFLPGNAGLQARAWSPDDRSFIYTTRDQLFIAPADGNLASNTVAIAAQGASDVVWLNPLEFVWLENAKKKGKICYAQKSADGHWQIHKLPHQGQIADLTAIDDHTIAWLQENYICRLDLTPDLTGANNPFNNLDADSYAVPATNNLLLWLDAASLDPTADDQTPVTGLADLSPQNNPAIVNRNPPVYNAPDSPGALNGNGTIHFESGDVAADATGLKTTRRLGLAGTSPRSIFAVMRRDAGRSMLVNIGGTATNGNFFGLCDQINYLYLPSGNFPGHDEKIIKAAQGKPRPAIKDGRLPRLPPVWHILDAVYDGTNCRSYVNGRLRGTWTLPFYTADKEVEIGLRSAGHLGANAAVSDGDFAELLVYNRALSYAEQRHVEDYLSAKWFGSRPLTPESPLVWIDPQMDGLTGFSYSKETGCLLLSRTVQGQDSFWRLDTKTGADAKAVRILQGSLLQDAQWAGPQEFAYASHELKHPGLVLADLAGHEQARLFEHASISWFKVTPDQKQILFFGSVSNEPYAGIWRFDLHTRQLQSMVSGTDHPSPYARNITPLYAVFKLPSGQSVNCLIYPPADFDRHNNKKYPLLLGNTVSVLRGSLNQYQAPTWAPAIAACGAYVVIIERTTWYAKIDQWEEDVMGVYQNFARDPCIDTRQVFLFGASAETPYLSDCVTKYSGLWDGAIFLSPSGLPENFNSSPFQPRPRISISIGGEEHQDDRLKNFQTSSLNSGVMVEYVIHPGESHWLVGNAAQFERLKAMMHLIFEE